MGPGTVVFGGLMIRNRVSAGPRDFILNSLFPILTIGKDARMAHHHHQHTLKSIYTSEYEQGCFQRSPEFCTVPIGLCFFCSLPVPDLIFASPLSVAQQGFCLMLPLSNQEQEPETSTASRQVSSALLPTRSPLLHPELDFRPRRRR